MVMALLGAQLMLFGMIGRRLPDLLRAVSGLPVQSGEAARLMRA
jgi:hypothetical protein